MRLYSTGKSEVNHLEACVAKAEHRRLLVRALDAYYRVAETGGPSAEDLLPLEIAIRHGAQEVWSRAGTRVCEVAREYEAGRQLLNRLASDPYWRIRFRVCLDVDRLRGTALQEELLKRFLCDRSTRIRHKAAEICDL